MKKIIYFLLLSSVLFGEAKFYIGTDVGVSYEHFSELDASSTAPIGILKVGYGDRESYAVEFSLDYTLNKSKIFSSSPDVSTDGDKFGFNVSLLKSFDWDIYILPFIKVGFGTGKLDVKRELETALAYGSFQATLGTYIPLSESFDLELGYEFRTTSYESVDFINEKQSYKSKSNIAFTGINYRF